jgi:hypothetical protein
VSKKLFVAWQDSASRRWFPIGVLSSDDSGYAFEYTQGVLEAEKESKFAGLQSFPDLSVKYKSKSLFPVFQNRVLAAGRPEYGDFIEWLHLSEDPNPVAILARTGGRRETDMLEVFPCPQETTDEKYVVQFFAHGIRHVEGANEKVQTLNVGDRLILVHDDQNKFDSLALRLESDNTAVGYCPRYVNRDFHALLKTAEAVVSVEFINPEPVPIQFRLLCQFSCSWPKGFVAFDYSEYKPIGTQEILNAPQSLAAPH